MSILIHGRAENTLRMFKDSSIHLVVTSPPYFVEKDYEKEWPYWQYRHMMEVVFDEVHRVLIPGRYLVINFGDYFNSGNRFYEADVPAVYPASLNYWRWGRSAGFDLQATRIWRKQFARMGIPFVCNTHPRPIFDYEHIWTFRKQNGDKTEWVNDRKLSQRGVIGEDWTSPARIDKHVAPFPIELPEWAIKVYTQHEGEIVLDPFVGSGTTCLAADNLGMFGIGIDSNLDYIEMAARRLNEGQGD